ncbi:protein ENHANCED DISEASE RESISTANCE 2-like [Hordeum vulgare]|nr:protein ENHANCED DISEASE RESISTANCE 2-like [Hordeum vulgare]
MCGGDDHPSRSAHAPARSVELLPKGSGPDAAAAAVRHEGWMVRYGRRKIGRSFFHTRYFVLNNKLLAYYKKQAKDNNMVGAPDFHSFVPEFLVRVGSFELI